MNNDISQTSSLAISPEAQAAAKVATQAAQAAPAKESTGRPVIPVPARDQALAGALPQWDLMPPMQFVRR
ncbi:hypothetical protein [Brevundimonas sp.]|uniref:hypothetical protein n=1 Tax=Brevundimonas sp. TaxID=1871086 RepID=UPI00289C5D68|nr:hypothetical protein [Brevundimonas sp.]